MNEQRARERGKKTQGSWNDSEERDSERVMAGWRGASSFCQDRGRTRVGKEGEKLSSVTPKTLLSSQESVVCRLMCVSTLVLWCTLRWQVWEPVSGSSGCPWLRLGGRDFWCDFLIAGVRQPARLHVCLGCWLQTLDEAQEVRRSWMSSGTNSNYQNHQATPSWGSMLTHRWKHYEPKSMQQNRSTSFWHFVGKYFQIKKCQKGC